MPPTSDIPVVLARFTDTGATLEIDGDESDVAAETEEDARREVLRRTVEVAANAHRDVLLVTTDSDGKWEVTVSPEGDIAEHAPALDAEQQSSTPGEGSSDRKPESNSDPDSDSDSDSAILFLPFATPTPAAAFAPAPALARREESTFTSLISAPPSASSRRTDSAATDATGPNSTNPDSTNPDSADPDSADNTPTDTETTDIDTTDIDLDTVFGLGPTERDSDDAVPTPVPSPRSSPVSSTEAYPAPVAVPAPATSAAPEIPSEKGGIPTLADFQASQPAEPVGPAQQGWQATVRRATFGSISPRPGPREMKHRDAISSVTRSLDGPRTICVINPKGGAHKTTAAMLIASTFGVHRGGYTLAWDNNETRGTLGWRAQRARHTNTAVNLLRDLDRFSDPVAARVGDLDNYVRSQADAQFDVLASDEDAAASSMIDAEAFSRLHQTLQRFYRIIVVDTGNNMRASNWEAAVDAADQLVIVSAMREDTAGGAAWMVEGLAQKGHEEKLRSAVTVLSSPEKTVDARLRHRLHDHFGGLTRAVVEVPHDTSLVSGGTIVIDALAPATREAWLHATATIADSL